MCHCRTYTNMKKIKIQIIYLLNNIYEYFSLDNLKKYTFAL